MLKSAIDRMEREGQPDFPGSAAETYLSGRQAIETGDFSAFGQDALALKHEARYLETPEEADEWAADLTAHYDIASKPPHPPANHPES